MLRKGTGMRALAGLFCILILSALPAGGVRPDGDLVPSSPGCEPTDLVDLDAQLVSVTSRGEQAVITVQIDFESHVALEAARIAGRRTRIGAPDEALGVDVALGAVPARVRRAQREQIELETGIEHHLFFTLSAVSAGVPVESTAHLTVDLDPARQPERIDNLVQYRARMEGP